jgi:hypothetical protein
LLVSQEKWDKAKRLMEEMKELINENDDEMPRKLMEEI